jgi:hypothetical protein
MRMETLFRELLDAPDRGISHDIHLKVPDDIPDLQICLVSQGVIGVHCSYSFAWETHTHDGWQTWSLMIYSLFFPEFSLFFLVLFPERSS